VFGIEHLHILVLERAISDQVFWMDETVADELIDLVLFLIGEHSTRVCRWIGRPCSPIRLTLSCAVAI
jgi:hypothetical protein